MDRNIDMNLIAKSFLSVWIFLWIERAIINAKEGMWKSDHAFYIQF